MRLRTQVLMITGSMIVSMAIFLYAVPRRMVLQGFTELETRSAVDSVRRALHAVDQELDDLRRTNNDWSAWDDTCAFVEGTHEGYVAANLNAPTMANLRLSAMVFLDRTGRVVAGHGLSRGADELGPAPAGLVAELAANPSLRRFSRPLDSKQGILVLPEAVMLVVTRPIVDSQIQGPIRGTLATARLLDDVAVQRLASTTRLNLVFRRPRARGQTPDASVTGTTGLDSERVVVRRTSPDVLTGLVTLPDLHGHPALELCLTLPRDAHKQGVASASAFALSALAIGLIFGVAVLLLLENRVLSRLHRLSEAVDTIGHSGDLSARITVSGRDELADLGSTVNRMLADLERSEAELRESRQTAWALLDASSDPAALLTRDLEIIALSGAAARSIGKPIEELVGRNLLDALPPESARARRRWAEEALRTKQPVREEEQEGDRHVVHWLHPILDADGQVARMALFAHDITDIRRVEDSARLATVGQLAAGVAHEFNNVLAAMMMRAERATLRRTRDEYEKLADLVLRSASRGAEICHGLTAFARPREPERQPLAVEVPIEAALAVAVRQVENAQVAVVRDYGTHGEWTQADAGQLEQVFLNLFINACHAMPGGGTLTIRTEYVPRAADQGQIVVVVSDTGSGILPEHLPRVFEPFFTTKGRLGDSDVPGTGLGLSVSHGIIRAHGGSIGVRSTPGVGTTFELRLRAQSTPLPAGPGEHPEGTIPAGHHIAGHRVLLADDEADLRDLIADTLGEQGYTVVAAASTPEAIAALQAEPFDLIITDLLMPGGGGREVIAAARRVPAPPPVVIITGRAEERVEQELADLGAHHCLRKPFNRNDILHAADATIAATS